MSIKQKAIHGVLWTGMAKASMQIVLFLLMLVLQEYSPAMNF